MVLAMVMLTSRPTQELKCSWERELLAGDLCRARQPAQVELPGITAT